MQTRQRQSIGLGLGAILITLFVLGMWWVWNGQNLPNPAATSCEPSAYFDASDQLIDRFATARRQAEAATSRVALAPTITEMERIWRDFKVFPIPGCVAAYHQLVSDGMSDTIQAMIYYSSQAGDNLVREKLQSAVDKFDKAKAERKRLQ